MAQVKVKGQVIDRENQLPIEFASILIQDTPIGVIANIEGRFELNIPASHQNRNIVISRTGYKSDTISPYTNQAVLVTLAQQQILLAEVTVKPIDPIEILRKAVRKIPENYSTEPVYLNAYYREMVSADSIFVKYVDAACKIYYCSYGIPYNERKASLNFFHVDLQKLDKKKPFPQGKNIVPHQDDAIQVLAIRKSNDLENFTSRWDFEETLKRFDISGTPLQIASADIVKLRKDLVDTTTWDYYKFKFEGIIEDGKNRVYKIAFEPKKNRESAMWQGAMYIDEESSAFVEFEYCASEKGKQYLREKYHEVEVDLRKVKTKKQLNKSFVKRTVRHTNQTLRVSYASYHGKWYLSHIRMVNDIENTGDVFDTVTYQTYLDLYVNDIQFQPVSPLSDEAAFITNYYSYLYHYPSLYTPEFWKQYNMPIPDEPYKKALEDLEKDKSLQEQFQEN